MCRSGCPVRVSVALDGVLGWEAHEAHAVPEVGALFQCRFQELHSGGIFDGNPWDGQSQHPVPNCSRLLSVDGGHDDSRLFFGSWGNRVEHNENWGLTGIVSPRVVESPGVDEVLMQDTKGTRGGQTSRIPYFQ